MSRLAPALALLLLLATSASAQEVTLQNDSFVGGQASFQGGFVAGEIGASRFLIANPVQVKKVQFLFGGAASTHTVTLKIYDDTAGSVSPGAELFSGDYQVTASNSALQEIDLTGNSVFVPGDFRVGLVFTHSGLPSIARDNDGITPPLNYIFAQGFGWVQSNLLGLTGDWILRAVVEESTYTVGGTVSGLNGSLTLQNNGGDDLILNADGGFTFATALADGAAYNVTVLDEPFDQDCVVTNGSGTISGANVTDVTVTCSGSGGTLQELKNDGFSAGQSVAFQAGFQANEIAASRFSTAGPATLHSVRFLFGGAAATTSVRLHVWDDTGALTPGTQHLVRDYLVTASDTAFQEIDLTADAIPLNGGFRIGLEFLTPGLPSVARDDDGNIDANQNLIFTGGSWSLSQTLGLTGDWVLRAVVDTSGGGSDLEILGIDDIGNDQGRQVRIEFSRADQDAPGAGTPVLHYEAYRRIDPLPGKLAGWDYVGQVPAHGDDTYNLVASTLADSTITDGMHWSVFLIRAATAIPTTYFDSAPDSGYSLDNLAPAPPQNLTGDSNLLVWDPAPETDFAYFTVYGSSDGLLDGGEVVLGTTADPQFGPGASHPYYLVTAVDFSGNEGLAAVLDKATAVEPVPLPARALRVHPNPFNPATTIRFSLDRAGPVDLDLFDARGRRVAQLLDNADLAAGDHSLAYRSALRSGTYYLRLRTVTGSVSTKLTIVR